MTATKSPSRNKPSRQWRIGFKLTLFFVLLTLAPLAVITVLISTARGALLAQGTVTIQSASQATVRQLDGVLSEQREFITVVGQLPELVRYAQNQFDGAARDSAQKSLLAFSRKARDYDSVAVVNREGKILLSSAAIDVGTDIQFQPYFQEALKGASYISDPSVSVITDQPVIFYSAPVKDDSGRVLAIVRSRVRLDGLWDLVEQDDGIAGPGSFGMLLDENGILLAHSSSRDNRKETQALLLFRAVAPLPAEIEQALVKEKRFGKATESQVQVSPNPEIAVHLADPGMSTFEARSDKIGVRNQTAMVRLQNKPWRYLVAAPISTFTATADWITLFATILTLIFGLVAVVTGLVLSRTITRPIGQLAQIADRISLGELDAKIEISRSDEIGELAKSFGRMQASLRGAIDRLRSRNPS